MYLIPRRTADRSALGSSLRVATALAVGWAALQAFRLLHSKHHRISPEPFSHTEAAPERRFLIVGDGTGVGIGSADPRATVAGRLCAAFPGTEVVNQARDGARTADIAEQIAASTGRFDLILIFVGGGNDVTRFSSYEAVALAGHVALDFAKSRSDQVAVITPPDVGHGAPLGLAAGGGVYAPRGSRAARLAACDQRARRRASRGVAVAKGSRSFSYCPAAFLLAGRSSSQRRRLRAVVCADHATGAVLC